MKSCSLCELAALRGESLLFYHTRMVSSSSRVLTLLSAAAMITASAERVSSSALLPLRLPELKPPQLPDNVRAFLQRVRTWSAGSGFGTGRGASGNLRDDGGTPGDMVVAATGDSEEWKMQVEKKGVKVWRRSVAGSKNDEIRGNGLIRASPRAVLELLRVRHMRIYALPTRPPANPPCAPATVVKR